MARAAINVRGDGTIIDITSLGRADLTVEHPIPGQYLLSGTLGMCPPPEGWGYVINQMDAGASVATSYADGVLVVSVAKDGEPADLVHSITLHLSVEDLPESEVSETPAPGPDELLLQAKAEAGRLRAIADAAIAPLQYAVELGEATEAETARLNDWKRYIVDLNRLPEQAGYPTEIDWPAPPA